MFKLRSKIVIAFSIIILTSSILMVMIITKSTRVGYEDFSWKSDVIYGERLLSPLREFYSKNNSWKGVENLIQIPRLRMPEMMENRNRNPLPPLLLTDENGSIVFNFPYSDRRKLSQEQLKHGLKVIVNSETVGYLFVGNMVVKKLTLEELAFLNRIKIIIIIVTLFVLLISIVFSYIFSYKLTKPITQLSDAAMQMKIGNYRVRVDIPGNNELSNLGSSFNSMANSIEESDKWKKRIIADSAHELRTPVTLIQGSLEMILEGVYKPDKKHIQNIYDETVVLTRLIKELQELSNAESNQMLLNIDSIDINSLVDSIINIFKTGNFNGNIQLLNRVNPTLPEISGDLQKIKQVLTNILNNSYRHTPSGGTIEFFGEVVSDRAVIKIHDTGCGINKKDLDKIFERFYRTDSSRNREHGGSGLGLAISREIIKLHKGSIYAESQEGLGTTVVIELPLKTQ